MSSIKYDFKILISLNCFTFQKGGKGGKGGAKPAAAAAAAPAGAKGGAKDVKKGKFNIYELTVYWLYFRNI